MTPTDAPASRRGPLGDLPLVLAVGLVLIAAITVFATTVRPSLSTAVSHIDPIAMSTQNELYQTYPPVGPLVVVSTPKQQLDAPDSRRFWLVTWIARGWLCAVRVRGGPDNDADCMDTRDGSAKLGDPHRVLLSFDEDNGYLTAWGAVPPGTTRVTAFSTAGLQTTVQTTELTGDDPPGTRATVFSVTLAIEGHSLGTVQFDALDAQGHVVATETHQAL